MAADPTTLVIVIDKPFAPDGITGGMVSRQLQRNHLASNIILKMINCPGGYTSEGFNVYDVLVADGRPIRAHLYGQIASMATVVMGAADKRYASRNASFMVHPAWVSDLQGNQYDLAEYLDFLKQEDKRILSFYKKVMKVKINDETFQDFYKNERFMSPDQAKEFGLIDGLIEEDEYEPAPAAAFKAWASSDFKSKRTMDEKSIGLLNGLAKSINALTAKLFGNVKSLAATLEDGTAIRIEGEAPVQGAAVFIVGADGTETPAPDGEHALGGDFAGTIITVAGGAITAVTEMTNEEKTALEAQIAALTAENETLKAQAQEATAKAEQAAAIVEEFNTIKAQVAELNIIRAQFEGKNTKPVAAAQNFSRAGATGGNESSVDRKRAAFAGLTQQLIKTGTIK